MTATFVVIATITMAIGAFSNTIPNGCPPDGSPEVVRSSHECLCQQYYECSRGEKVLRDCSPGMLFDRNSNSCVAFDATDFSHCEDGLPFARKCPPDGMITLFHETDCTLYYRCQNGRKNLQHCKAGTRFDHVKGLCVWKDVAQCAPNMGLTLCPGTTRQPSAGSGRTAKLPHPCLSDRYYKCANGVPSLEKCQPGLQFDYIKQICSSPTTPTTTQTTTTSTTTQSPTTPTTTQATTTSTTTQTPATPTTTQSTTTPRNIQTSSTISPECPIDCSEKVRLPNPADCSSYYECYRGRKTLLRCSTGLRYNRVTDTCDWPRNVVC